VAIRPARFAAIMKAHFDAVRRYVLVRFLLGATSQLIVFAGLVLAVLIPLVTLQGEAASVEELRHRQHVHPAVSELFKWHPHQSRSRHASRCVHILIGDGGRDCV
jgi:hypothetical protein